MGYLINSYIKTSLDEFITTKDNKETLLKKINDSNKFIEVLEVVDLRSKDKKNCKLYSHQTRQSSYFLNKTFIVKIGELIIN